jgi:hypothetical protein
LRNDQAAIFDVELEPIEVLALVAAAESLMLQEGTGPDSVLARAVGKIKRGLVIQESSGD